MSKKVYINECFFEKWTPEMAWVLGVIYTDGYFGAANKKGTRRLYIAQKDPEILDKIKLLMNSQHKIIRNTQTNKIDKIYYFSLTNDAVYQSLVHLGIRPRKSLSLVFPQDIPFDCVRHFLRGCWDGDGSFYYENDNPKLIRGDFVSGSYEFIQEYVNKLNHLLKLNINLYKKHKSNNSYYIKLAPKQTVKLFELFYYNVSEQMYLIKKYNKLRLSYELLGNK
jgi:hypothetical protein